MSGKANESAVKKVLLFRPAVELLKDMVGGLSRVADSSRTSPEVREWDGPAALPPPTVLRVRRGLVRKGAPPCPARPLFTQ
jgi:hypothetical protein